MICKDGLTKLHWSQLYAAAPLLYRRLPSSVRASIVPCQIDLLCLLYTYFCFAHCTLTSYLPLLQFSCCSASCHYPSAGPVIRLPPSPPENPLEQTIKDGSRTKKGWKEAEKRINKGMQEHSTKGQGADRSD